MVDYDNLLSELCAMEYWDQSYYHQELHDRTERDACDNRGKRRTEIVLAILKVVHSRDHRGPCSR